MEPISDLKDPDKGEEFVIDYIEKIPLEKIEGLAVGIAVNAVAFSKPPFNEPWEDIVEDEGAPLTDVGKVFEVTKSFLYNPRSLRLSTDENENEIWELLSPEGNLLYKIRTLYPLSKIIRIYSREIQDQKSVFLVRYINTENKEKIVDLSKTDIIDNPKEPIAVFRIRNIEQNVAYEIIDEISEYIDENQKVDLRGSLLEDHTAYLGEIANLKNDGLFVLYALKASLFSFKPFPKQIVYITKPGTSIEDENRTFNPISRIIEGVYKSVSLTEERKVYQDKAGHKSVVYIYKINNRSGG